MYLNKEENLHFYTPKLHKLNYKMELSKTDNDVLELVKILIIT